MATFKVGQRVKVVAATLSHECVGREATVLSKPYNASSTLQGEWVGYLVDVDGIGSISPCGFQYCFPQEQLAPLTDPKADAFIESIKRLKPYEEPKVPVPVSQCA